VQILVGLFVLGIIASPFAGSTEDKKVPVGIKISSGATFAPTTTAPVPTTTARATTTVAPTTTNAPTTTTVRAPTTIAPATTAAPAAPRATAVDVGAAPCATGQMKGNNNSGIFHAPGQRDYGKTTANVTCFDTEADAIAAGFRKALR
jgi:hypothetical protein